MCCQQVLRTHHPFCNVHKSELTELNTSIGYSHTDSKWKVSDNQSRADDLAKLQAFQRSLPKNISEDTKHKKSLNFMAEHGLRQLGEPRVGVFADRIKPDPLHLEINNWTHCLHILYFEAVRRNRFDAFCKVLRSPAKDYGDAPAGCGLNFVGKMIEEHYMDEKKRYVL